MFVAFDADGTLADLLELQCDLVGYGLHLLRVAAIAEQEIVRESGNAGKIQNFDLGGFFGLSGANGYEPVGQGCFRIVRENVCTGTSVNLSIRFDQKLVSDLYRTMKGAVFFRFAAMAALFTTGLYAQPPASAPPDSTANPAAAEAAPSVAELNPDPDDPGVIRARKDLERIQLLITQGALPAMRLRKAQEDLKNAEDLSILQANLFGKDLTVEQADQMLFVAERLVLRRQRSMIEMQQLVQSGVISRSEAEASGADFDRAQTELHLAQTRVNLIVQMAEALRLQKSIASLETEVEAHPEWAGKVYTKYDGNGIFRPQDLQKISLAFESKFARPLPISADGETATHRAMGFDHRGRVDVAVNPDMPEGTWLMQYLQANRIPYFAFRMAVPGMATGAHIHLGPQSTRLKIASLD